MIVRFFDRLLFLESFMYKKDHSIGPHRQERIILKSFGKNRFSRLNDFGNI
jgi:hypothetical protein